MTNMATMEYSGMSNMPMYQEAPQELIQQPQEPILDDAAFEEAFAQAKADIEMQEESELQHTQADQDIGHDHALKHFAAGDLPLEDAEQVRIGSDTIEYRDKDALQARVDDGDELAKTAAQLLDSVSHDQSQKFRESSFLALMRRIRDREVKVDGDEFRDVSSPSPPGHASSISPANFDHLQFRPI